jgi:hypothetical protein
MFIKILTLLYTFLLITLTNTSEAKDFLRIIKPIYIKCISDTYRDQGYILKIKYDTAYVRFYIDNNLINRGATEEEIYKIIDEDENKIYLERQLYESSNPTITVDRSEGKIFFYGHIQYNCQKINKKEFSRILAIEENISKVKTKPNKF